MATSKKPVPLLVRVKETTPPSEMTGGRLISEVAAVGAVGDQMLFLLERPSDGMAYKITLAKLSENVSGNIQAHGGIYGDSVEASSPQVLQTGITSTPVQVTQFTANMPSVNTTSDHTADAVTINLAGDYLITCQISFAGSTNTTYEFDCCILSDSPITATGLRCTRRLSNADVGSASFTGVYTFAVGDIVALQVATDGTGNLTVHDIQLSMVRV